MRPAGQERDLQPADDESATQLLSQPTGTVTLKRPPFRVLVHDSSASSAEGTGTSSSHSNNSYSNHTSSSLTAPSNDTSPSNPKAPPDTNTQPHNQVHNSIPDDDESPPSSHSSKLQPHPSTRKFASEPASSQHWHDDADALASPHSSSRQSQQQHPEANAIAVAGSNPPPPSSWKFEFRGFSKLVKWASKAGATSDGGKSGTTSATNSATSSRSATPSQSQPQSQYQTSLFRRPTWSKGLSMPGTGRGGRNSTSDASGTAAGDDELGRMSTRGHSLDAGIASITVLSQAQPHPTLVQPTTSHHEPIITLPQLPEASEPSTSAAASSRSLNKTVTGGATIDASGSYLPAPNREIDGEEVQQGRISLGAVAIVDVDGRSPQGLASGTRSGSEHLGPLLVKSENHVSARTTTPPSTSSSRIRVNLPEAPPSTLR